MCGIVGYTGFQDAYDIVINGLRRLEYRGYDSAGIVLEDGNNKLEVEKTKGKVDDLVNISEGLKGTAKIGMGHTRWATMEFLVIEIPIRIFQIMVKLHCS
jgi:glucosamine--fructose-6-phosphate aminotransferase (isomerizing)